MKADLYTKIILTVIAICMVFNILKEADIVSTLKADGNLPNPGLNNLKTNSDGSINVRMVAADVIDVRPASGAEFKVKPASRYDYFSVEPSSNAEFKVKPASKYDYFVVEPSSSAKFTITPNSSAEFKVKQASGSEISVKPAYNSVFTVIQKSDLNQIESPTTENYLHAYPNPAKDQITISYGSLSDQQSPFLTLCNINGQIVDYIRLDSQKTELTIDVSDYLSGIYIYTCGNYSGRFIVK